MAVDGTVATDWPAFTVTVSATEAAVAAAGPAPAATAPGELASRTMGGTAIRASTLRYRLLMMPLDMCMRVSLQGGHDGACVPRAKAARG